MRLALILGLCLTLGFAFGQKLDHRLGYLIVQSTNEDQLSSVLREHSIQFRSGIVLEKVLSSRLGIYLIRFDHSQIHEKELLHSIRNDRRVTEAQFDHITTLRSVPNDPMFAEQWQWINTGQTGGITDADVDADLAWDITQGGVTALGDTIVVAIIDDGLNYNHPDITQNTWINRHEIPDNGLDDDSNGYVDDIYGWNVYSDSNNVLRAQHGLAVAGVVGAVGNNGIGITGINWRVKLMTIVGGSPESSAIAAYAYAMEQRIRYEESNGERGAFVVATNSSWGIDYGQPADAPLWCAFYDSLGVHGILSAAATANNNDDIDIVGDLPTACTSEYLLSVTALNHSNMRTFSAFGLEHVDFGAPGDNIFTTRGFDGYGSSSGTSFASPMAAGLVALLYSAPCTGLAELAHSNPSETALFIKNIILNSVDPVAELANITKTGGALNAGNAMLELMQVCSDCPIPIGINSTVLSDTEVLIDWIATDTADAVNARYKPLASSEWDTLLNVSAPLLLTDLTGCTDYEIEFEAICADTSTGFQSGITFKTDGCCELPAIIEGVADEISFSINWSHVLAAEYYLVQWRVAGESEWMEVVTSLDEILIEHLEPCTFYEYRLQTNCDTTETGFSDIFSIRTQGCGNCIDLSYCETSSENSSQEFLDSLQIGPLVNHSGQNGGYAFFENLNPAYVAGETYPVMLRPGFDFFQSFHEQFRIWLDANQDGVFEESEMLLDTVLLSTDTVLLDEIQIPSGALAGSTRMRVSMAFYNPPAFVDQEPCGEINFGEIEDYCVTILRDGGCPRVDTVLFDAINFTSAFMYWPEADGAIAYTYRYRAVGESDFIEMATVDTTAFLSALTKCTMYEVQVRTVCISDTTAYDSIYRFETDCDVAVETPEIYISTFNVYPNPASDRATIELQADESGDYRIALYSMHGRTIFNDLLFLEADKRILVPLDNLDQLPPGIYFITLSDERQSVTRKLVKL